MAKIKEYDVPKFPKKIFLYEEDNGSDDAYFTSETDLSNFSDDVVVGVYEFKEAAAIKVRTSTRLIPLED